MLAQASRVFIKCDIFITELRMIAYFGQHVTMPFLNCIELVDAVELMRLQKQMHQDLLQANSRTLRDYELPPSDNRAVIELTGELETKLHKILCDAAAECLQRQSGAEYGFAGDVRASGSRAADLSAIPESLLRQAPTNNLIAERQLSRFDRLATSARCHNQNKTHDTMRDNMVLAEAKSSKLAVCATTINQVLTAMNIAWSSKQKKIKLDRMEQKHAQKNKQSEQINKLLITCKTWTGPCTSREELLRIIQGHPDIEKKIVQTELAYYIHSHPSERASHPELFRQTMLSLEDKVVNLCMLLDNDDGNAVSGSAAVLDLPTLEDAAAVLGGHTEPMELYSLNNLCVNMWLENDTPTWYIGYFKRQLSKTEYEVEQLLRKDSCSSVFWVHPAEPIIEKTDNEQILCTQSGHLLTPVGQWDFGRNNTFCLKNINIISEEFEKIKHTFR